MAKSKAEEIYDSWNSKSVRNAISADGIKNGLFHTFLEKNGFKPLVDGLEKLCMGMGKTTGSVKYHDMVEQIWKLIDKVYRNHGYIPAFELFLQISQNDLLKSILDMYTNTYTAGTGTGRAAQSKIDRARNTYLSMLTIEFKNVGKRVSLLKKLGAGGYGAVFLGEDQDGERYAVKYEKRSYEKVEYKDTESGKAQKITSLLTKYHEGIVTTTCMDYTAIGAHVYYLLQLGEPVDYSKITLADIVNVFDDLHSIQNYSQNYMKTHIIPDVGLFHFDIHPGNMMKFKGKLRLIDFGLSVIFDRGAVDEYKKHSPVYGAHATFDAIKAITNASGGSPGKYIENWYKSAKVNPECYRCKDCNMKYYFNRSICMLCGSKNIEKTQWSNSEVFAIANLTGKHPDQIRDDHPLVKGVVAKIMPEEYGCMVLTVTLIKAIWGALKASGKCSVAISNQNTDVYMDARKKLPQLLSASRESALLIELLLMWFDEMMVKLINGERFTAKNAVLYFDKTGGLKSDGKTGRKRSYSI